MVQIKVTILNYINKYGDFTFSEKEFNEVDNIIFSVLTYIDFNNVVEKGLDKKITIFDAIDLYFSLHKKKYDKNDIYARKKAIKVLEAIKNKKRYKDLYLYNYIYIGDENHQFCAITVEVNIDLIFISFGGTDSLISGWEEDARMTYLFPVEAQVKAINYLNEYSKTKEKIIVGGHSKGGNLALVSSMYCTSSIKKRIIRIYNNDGPGLKLEQIESQEYKSICQKLVHLVPNYSVVGLLLINEKYITIKSSKKSILAHNFMTWKVKDDTFERTELSKFSLILNRSISNWMEKYDNTVRKNFFTTLFDICRDIELKDLGEMKKNKLLFIKLIKSAKKINPEVKEIAKDLILMINKCNKEYKKEVGVK